MHFGTRMYTVLSPTGVLTVVSPSDLPMLWIWAVVTLLVFVGFYFLHAKTRSFILVSLLMLVILGFISSNTSLTMDAAGNRLSVRTVDFFYPKTQEYAFSSLMGADVTTSENADAVRLVFNGGSDLQLTFYNQMRGKSEAVFAINQYVQQHGGKGLPY